MYKRTRLSVSVRQLEQWSGKRLPETKEGSYTTANEWFAAKKAEIDGAPVVAPTHPEAAYLRELTKRAKWADENDQPGRAEAFEAEIERVKAGGLRQYTEVMPWEAEEQLGERDASVLSAHDLAEDSRLWRDRLAPTTTPALPAEETMGGLVDSFTRLELGRVRDGAIKPATFDRAQAGIRHFLAWIGADYPIAKFNAAKWEEYYLHLQTAPIARVSAKIYLTNVRIFLAWAVETDRINPPRNLFSRRIRFKVPPTAPQIFSREEIHTILAKCPDVLKCWVLLMLNTGSGPNDLSALRQSEVDWQAGRIRRRRTKTGDRFERVPTVDYPLWPETFRLLQACRATETDRVFLLKNGRPLVYDRILETGKRIRTDNVHKTWARALGVGHKPLKLLRKTGASVIARHPIYGRFDGLYLGHSPKTIAEAHYTAVPRELFDEAVKYLGVELGSPSGRWHGFAGRFAFEGRS